MPLGKVHNPFTNVVGARVSLGTGSGTKLCRLALVVHAAGRGSCAGGKASILQNEYLSRLHAPLSHPAHPLSAGNAAAPVLGLLRASAASAAPRRPPPMAPAVAVR